MSTGRSIKQLKPRIGGRTKQGYYDVSRSVKYYGPRPCIYRSSWEWKFMLWCERMEHVVSWSSEPFTIPYLCLETGKTREYNIYFIVHTDKQEKQLIEVKPLKEVNDAEQFGKMLKLIIDPVAKKRYTMANKVAAKNWSKWTHARKLCTDKGWRFMIVTERFLNKL